MPTLQQLLAEACGLKLEQVGSMRAALTDLAAKADRSTPEWQMQIDEIDLTRLSQAMGRLLKCATVLETAFNAMDAGRQPHPLDAFLYACDINYVVNEDEFNAVLAAWVKITASSVVPIDFSKLVTHENIEQHPTSVLMKAHRHLGTVNGNSEHVSELRSLIARELLRRRGFRG